MRQFATRLLGGLIAFLLVPGLALGQANTGKITGEVLEAETGDPLPGANVRLVGTGYGAATNQQGEYTIFNVPPGTYTVVVSFVGYQTERRENVEIVSGITRRLNFELQQAEFEGQEVVVTATEPLVNPTATNAVRRLGREELEKLPTRSPQTYYAIQPGVTVQNGEVHVRGGRSNETDYLLEGISSRSLLGTDNVVPVIPEALQETQVFAGGYSANRGGANGGIVQQTLRTGGEELSAMVQYEGDQLANSFNNTFSYGDQDIVGTIGGPLYWDNVRFFVAANYRETDNSEPLFWDGARLNESVDGGLCGDITAQGCHAPIDDIRGDTAIAPLQWDEGELPGIGRPSDELRVNGTLKFDFDPLSFRVSFVQLSGDRRINDLPIRSMFNGQRLPKRETMRRLVSLQPTYFLSDNTYLEGTFGIFQFENETYDPLLGPATARDQGGLLPDVLAYQDRQAVAEALGIEPTESAMSQNDYTRFWQGRYQTPPLYRFNGFRFNRPGAVETGYGKTTQSYWTTSLGLVSQQGNHELRVGGEYKRWTARRYGVGSGFLAARVRSDPAYTDAIAQETDEVAFDVRQNGVNYYGYDEFGNEIDSGPDGPKHPVTAAAYINDKIEYEDIIVNLGLRFNYYDMDLWEPIDPANPPFNSGEAQVEVGGENGLQEASAKTDILPRVGLSFPVTDRTVFHLQYGKFSQMPDMADAYTGRARMGEIFRGRFFFSQPFSFDLDPIKTTQYEIGFGHQFSDFAAFDLTAYYRRTDGQLQIVQQETEAASEAADYNNFVNGDFSITRGFEVSVRSRRIGGAMAMVNYSLNDAKGTNSAPSGQVAAIEGGLETPSMVQPLAFMQKHQGSVVFDYRTGSDQPRWAQNIGANLLFQFSSGHKYTSSTGGIGQQGADDAGLLPDNDPRNRVPDEPINSSTTPFTSTLDLRLEKGIDLGPASATAYIYVQNIFNRRNIENVYLRTGNATNDGFLNQPELSEEIVANRGQQYVGYYQQINLNNRQHYRDEWGRDLLGAPRQVRVGFQVTY